MCFQISLSLRDWNLCISIDAAKASRNSPMVLWPEVLPVKPCHLPYVESVITTV